MGIGWTTIFLLRQYRSKSNEFICNFNNDDRHISLEAQDHRRKNQLLYRYNCHASASQIADTGRSYLNLWIVEEIILETVENHQCHWSDYTVIKITPLPFTITPTLINVCDFSLYRGRKETVFAHLQIRNTSKLTTCIREEIKTFTSDVVRRLHSFVFQCSLDLFWTGRCLCKFWVIVVHIAWMNVCNRFDIQIAFATSYKFLNKTKWRIFDFSCKCPYTVHYMHYSH